jgi:hypothetical protein
MLVDKVTGGEGRIVQSLRRAHEERDVELALSLYAEHAELRVFDHASLPDSPKVFRGKAQVAEYLKNLYGQRLTQRVGAALQDVVSGEGRISFNVASESTDGRKRLAAQSYEVHEGKIVYQVTVEAS